MSKHYLHHSFRFLFAACIAFLVLTTIVGAQSTCSSTQPCAQGCCSNSGNCGFGPAYCGAGNCTSSCNAQAQCGQYAPSNQTKCPLNVVCCSQYGFCGTTSDFCGTGCQNGCTAVKRPSCSTSSGSSTQRRIGYYESWNLQRPCDVWQPEAINPSLWTHLNFAFALIDNNYRLAQMTPGDAALYPRFTALKQQNPGLKVFISVGGWSAGGAIFSSMCASAANRQNFISSAIAFMQTYGFDGIDIDWEYPVAGDRGGVAADLANFVQLMKELRAACGTRYGITTTLPSTYWYLQGFDIINLSGYVDWFNFMSYDIHGTWDGNNPYTSAVVNPHTNLTEIGLGLDLLWRNGIDPSKVVMGLGFYGRSFTLKQSSCNTPGCAFSGGGNPGNCTGTSGILSNAEIQRTIQQYSLTPTLDTTAAIKWMTWNSNQWVSYDDQDTFKLKQSFANSLCLGGTMAWALDLDDPTTSQSTLNLNSDLVGSAGVSYPQFTINKLAAMRYQYNSVGEIYWTDCAANPTCPQGMKMMPDGLGHGKVFDTDLQVLTGNGCHGGAKGFNRALCVQDNVIPYNCGWWGKPGACNTKCPSGYIEITGNSHLGKSPKSCKSGRYMRYCCSGLYADVYTTCPADSANQIFGKGLAPRAANVQINAYGGGQGSSGSGGGGINIGGPLACFNNRFVANTLIPVGVAGFWAYGSFIGWPTSTPSPTSNSKKPTSTTTITTTSFSTYVGTRTCDGSIYPQPCLHYSSVIRSTPSFSRLTCPLSNSNGNDRPAVTQYNKQHHTSWINGWTQSHTKPDGRRDSCQRDEWPPARFHQGAAGQWIRLLPSWQNGQVANGANGWNGFCPNKASSTTVHQGGPINLAPNGLSYIETTYESRIYTVSVMQYTFTNMPNLPDDGITANPCWPQTLTYDPGFALLNYDSWYNTYYHGGVNDYSTKPGTAVTSGKRKPSKRDLNAHELIDPDEIYFDNGNITRRPTAEELRRHYGIVRCESKNCEIEAANLGLELQKPRQPAPIQVTSEVRIAPAAAVTATLLAPSSARLSPNNLIATTLMTARPSLNDAVILNQQVRPEP